MSSSDLVARRTFVLGLGAAALAAAGGCTLTPLYGAGAGPDIALAYAEPHSRVEQIVYQELATTFPRGTAGIAPSLSVTVQSAVTRLVVSASNDPRATNQVNLTASVRLLAADGDQQPLFTGNRTASAQFTKSGQSIADNQARADADERAARALAETIRLALLASLANGGGS